MPTPRASVASTAAREAAAAMDDLRRLHPALMRRADEAFRSLDAQHTLDARLLESLSGAWSTYLGEYSRLTDDVGTIQDLRRVLARRRTLNRVLDAAGVTTPTTVVPPLTPTRHDVATLAEFDAPPDPLGPSKVDGLADDARDDSPDPMLDPVAAPQAWPEASERPSLRHAKRAAPAHHIRWLPPRPMVTASDSELYVWTSTAPGELARDGLSTPDVFLLGRPDPRRLASRPQGKFLVRLAVRAGNAVPLAEYADDLPASMQHRSREAADIYVLPTSWLGSVTVNGCLELDPDGCLVHSHALADTPIRVSFRDADHGVPGLPNSAVHWPDRRRDASGYLVLPLDPDEAHVSLLATPGWLPLRRRRPSIEAGTITYEVQLPLRVALDIQRSRAMLSQTPVVADSLAALGDHDIALPWRELRRGTVTRLHTSRGAAVPAEGVVGRTLRDALPLGDVDEIGT